MRFARLLAVDEKCGNTMQAINISKTASLPCIKCGFRRRKAGEPAGGAGDIAFKVTVDRLLLTPPYLAITLASLRLLQGLGVQRSLGETRALYRRALLTNWKVRGWNSHRRRRRRRRWYYFDPD